MQHTRRHLQTRHRYTVSRLLQSRMSFRPDRSLNNPHRPASVRRPGERRSSHPRSACLLLQRARLCQTRTSAAPEDPYRPWRDILHLLLLYKVRSRTVLYPHCIRTSRIRRYSCTVKWNRPCSCPPGSRSASIHKHHMTCRRSSWIRTECHGHPGSSLRRQ